MERGSEAAHSTHSHTGVSGSVSGHRGCGQLRQGFCTHQPEYQVEEQEGPVLVAKAKCGTFQKEGRIRLEL